MKKNKFPFNFRVGFLLFFLLLFLPGVCKAMPPGTLLYRTSSNGKMFGYSGDPLLEIDKGTIKNINSGHAAIYIGKENGVDYIVEALGGGIVKTPAKDFVNTALGEKFLGAKIPRGLDAIAQAKVVALAKSMAEKNLAYDLDFKKQKGPGSGEWTCVGLTEKLYESANISNPNNLGGLEYDPNYYAYDITPDGYDNTSVVNNYGDCFAKNYEFSKIARRTNMLMPAPELIGYDGGVEHDGDRYIFMPYTQFLQPSLDDVKVDVDLEASFNDEAVRGKVSNLNIALRWTLINNPLSSISAIASKVKEVAVNIADKLFGNNNETTALALNNEITSAAKTSTSTTKKTASSSSTKKTTAAKKTAKTTASKTTAAKSTSLKSALAAKTSTAKTTTTKAATTKTTAAKTSAAKTTAAKTTSPKTTSATKTVARLVDLKPVVTVNTAPKVNSSPSPSSGSNTNNPVSVNTASNQNDSNDNSSDSTSTNDDTATTTEDNSTSSATSTEEEQTNNDPIDWPKLALIKRIYSTGDNDWVELYNPTDHDFDLQAASFRLEKTKTAVTPSLLMRIGDLADGSYPGGTLIKAHDSYLIVRDDANNYYKNQADAIATRDEFTWDGNGYTLYLGNGAISSSTDLNIVDAVGFGNEATYFQGSGPAPEIKDDYVLTKTASTSDNSKDFSLVLSDEPGLITATSSDTSTTPVINTPDWEAYAAPTPINSDGLTDLWHFDECYGANIKWVIGKWGCGMELNPSGSNLTATLSPAYDLDNLSFSFNYKRENDSRINIELSNSYNEQVKLIMNPGNVYISGLPETKGYYFGDYLNDDSWHQATFVIDRVDQYWALYIDGEVKIKETYSAALPEMDKLKVFSDNGPALIDELALWHRDLSEAEIKEYFNDNAPFSPVAPLEAQQAPVLKHFWHFDEGHGLVSSDEIGTSNADIPEGIWDNSGRLNTGIISKPGKDLSINLKNSIQGKDYSLSFWWRNSASPEFGKTIIALTKNNQNIFGLVPEYNQTSYWYNNRFSSFLHDSQDLIPHDDAWHYLALTYDSYRYLLSFYVDGVLESSSSLIFVPDGDEPEYLSITNNNCFSSVDELGIWQGTLSAKQIEALYNNTPAFQ